MLEGSSKKGCSLLFSLEHADRCLFLVLLLYAGLAEVLIVFMVVGDGLSTERSKLDGDLGASDDGLFSELLCMCFLVVHFSHTSQVR